MKSVENHSTHIILLFLTFIMVNAKCTDLAVYKKMYHTINSTFSYLKSIQKL